MITPQFLQTYDAQTPPWGFGGMGEVIMLRTYSRPIDELDRNETWTEVCTRAINGSIQAGADLNQEDAEALFDHMFNLRCSLSGRALWQMGTPLVEKQGAASLNNCLHPDTEIVTRDGVRRIGELAGTEVEVLTEKGWVIAPVHSFGVQATQRIVFRPANRHRSGGWMRNRTSLRHEVVATPEHGWMLASGERTYDLQVGDVVRSNVAGDPTWPLDSFIHGFVFGDGNMEYQRVDGSQVHKVRLCGPKDLRHLDSFLEAGWIERKAAPNGDPILASDRHVHLKALPEDPNSEYAAGFLEGWIEADGHRKANGDIALCSQHLEAGAWLRKFAAAAGWLLTGETVGAQETTNYGKRSAPLMRYTLTRAERAWTVESIEAEAPSEVFCATVPEHEAFTLASGIYTSNCYFTNIETIADFEFIFDMLMVGGGVGFSVERAKIHDLPKVKAGVTITHERTNDADIIVPDKREGWSRLVHSVLKSYFYTGKSFSYSTLLLREYGAVLKTFGGTASGPGALIDGIAEICKILDNRVGKKLRSIDVLDIVNIIGVMVVAGSSRRSAQIAIGDPDDALFLRAKNWGSGNIPGWRGNSNNSIYADGWDEIPTELWKGYNGEGEPYGLINRKLARRVGRLGEVMPDPSIEGFNPCAEIGLGSGESCNLATIFLPNITSLEQFLDVSRLLYLVQKSITELPYPYEKTTKIVQKNRRLGQSITGVMQCSEEQWSWLSPGYEALRELDAKYSAMHNIPESIRLTTVQPSGTLSTLPGLTPGGHPGFAKYYVRRVRFGSNDPLLAALRERGHDIEFDMDVDGSRNHTRQVVSFPCVSPEGAVLAEDMTAIEQMEVVKRLQTEWADNAVSVTVYYRKEELPEIQAWLAENYDDSVKSISFLLHSDHGFNLPPYEECSQAEYERMLAKIDMSIPLVKTTSGLVLEDCATGACPIR